MRSGKRDAPVSAQFFDRSCNSIEPVGLVIRLIQPEELFTTEDGRRCVYVNMDNCIECERLAGRECNLENRLGFSYGCYEYMRWGQAWMLRALSEIQLAAGSVTIISALP